MYPIKPKLLTAVTTRNDPDENRSLEKILNQFRHLAFVHFSTLLNNHQWAMASLFTTFLDHRWRATVGRTPLDEWSARRQTSTWQHTTLTTNIHDPGGIQTHNLSRWAAKDLRLKPRVIGTGICSIYIPLFRFLQGTEKDIENKYFIMHKVTWFHASVTVQKKCSFFCDVTCRRLVASYRRFGTTN
jgi:hypothetical protein